MEFKSKYDLIKYFNELGFKKGVEIGVAGGHFSEAMCKAIPGLELWCIDIWHPYHGNRWSGSRERNENGFKEATERLSKYNTHIIREMSMDAVKRFRGGSLDFVFIDSNHDFDYVMQDLIEWTKRVRIGGIVSGDDYYPLRNGGVIEAVDAYTNAHKIKFNLTDPFSEHIRDRGADEHPIYWWIKEEE
jgi:hypothetical protein